MNDDRTQLRPGESILGQRYLVEAEIGSGGMGAVYRARDTKLDRNVALKIGVLDASSERQIREAKALAQIRSPNVVQVYDFEEVADGQSLIVMELIDGNDLQQKISQRDFSHDQAVSWMKEICTGMEAVESAGLIHRDIKPSNVIVDRNAVARVMDFGLARSRHWERLTIDRQMLGTPMYIAPEQIDDAKGVDVRADVYSFGATFYHVLTGQAPFESDSLYSLLMKHKTEPPIRPSSRNTEIPSHISDCLERCLAKTPTDRFQCFADIRTVIEAGDDGDSWSYGDDEGLAAFETIYRMHRARLLQKPTPGESASVHFDFPGDRRLEILFGDIAEQDVDAVVSSDDSELSMGGGVSMALRRKAGAELLAACQRLQPVRLGRSVVTPGFNLKAKYVFHGVTIGFNPGSVTFASRDVISEIVDSCFFHAESLNVESMAFPLLGTGAGRFPTDIGLDTIFRTVARRLLRRATTVKRVVIVLNYDKGIVHLH